MFLLTSQFLLRLLELSEVDFLQINILNPILSQNHLEKILRFDISTLRMPSLE